MNQQMSQKQLLQWINMVSFAYKELRKQGLRAYADQYGPLTIDSAKVGDHWDWATQPWPWEGGMC